MKTKTSIITLLVVIVILFSFALTNDSINFTIGKTVVKSVAKMNNNGFKDFLIKFITDNDSGIFLKPLLFYAGFGSDETMWSFSDSILTEKINKDYSGTFGSELTKHLKNSDDKVRMSAVKYLGLCKNFNATTQLIEVARSDKNPEVISTAITSLFKVNHPLDKETFNFITKSALKSKHSEVISTVFMEIYGSNDVRFTDALIEELREKDHSRRLLSLYALSRVGNSKAIKHIKPFINDKETDIREAAIDAIKLIKTGD